MAAANSPQLADTSYIFPSGWRAGSSKRLVLKYPDSSWNMQRVHNGAVASHAVSISLLLVLVIVANSLFDSGYLKF
ncbi:hypothetical protein HDU86_003328 [Geranomyces michiganensis]|nr:hypothetical protein HDU86_003328 [Geranomyces michiganensis]